MVTASRNITTPVRFVLLVLPLMVAHTFSTAAQDLVKREAPAPIASGGEFPSAAAGSWSPSMAVIGGTVLLTSVSLIYDQRIANGLIGWKDRNNAVGSVSPIVTEMGTGGFALGVLGAFGTYGYLAEDDRAFEVASRGVASFFATGLAVQVVKHLSGRERPEVSTREGGFWHGPFGMYRQGPGQRNGIGSYDAFASGHTTTAFSLATVFADVYDDKPWVGYVSYSLASVVAVSRITERTHWLSDCIVGAFIGIYGTKLVEEIMTASPGVMLSPGLDPDWYGVCLRFEF